MDPWQTVVIAVTLRVLCRRKFSGGPLRSTKWVAFFRTLVGGMVLLNDITKKREW